MKEICTLLVKLHIIFSRMQRVNQHARPSIIQVGCATCCYQVCLLDHANVGTADLGYSSGPCQRNVGSSSSKGLWQPRSSATKGRALRNPRLLSGYQRRTAAEGPTLATAQGPKTGHSPISYVQDSNRQGGAGWWYLLLPADSRTRSKHEHKYRHFNSTCEQYRHSFFVQTVPEWNLLPEACIKADTTEAFKASLRPTP